MASLDGKGGACISVLRTFSSCSKVMVGKVLYLSFNLVIHEGERGGALIIDMVYICERTAPFVMLPANLLPFLPNSTGDP